jgi:preprotein translocase subunit SecD
MICPQCGADAAPEGAPYCPMCGAALPRRRSRLRLALFIGAPVIAVALIAGLAAYFFFRSDDVAALDPGKDAIAVVVRTLPTENMQVDDASLKRTVVAIKARLAAAGYDAYTVASDRAGTITVRLPLGTEYHEATRVITGSRLEFIQPKDFGAPYDSLGAALKAAGVTSEEQLPEGDRIIRWGADADNPAEKDQWFAVTAAPALDGSMVGEASWSYSEGTKRPKVNFTFTSEGAQEFARLTAQMADAYRVTSETQRLAIVLGGEVKSAPQVVAEIPDGQAEITGTFTVDQVKNLAQVITSGQDALRLEPANP